MCVLLIMGPEKARGKYVFRKQIKSLEKIAEAKKPQLDLKRLPHSRVVTGPATVGSI